MQDDQRDGPGPCPNCGSLTLGRFCPDCGQENRNLLPTFGALVREALEETIGVDGKLPRSLRALAWPPGHLTLAWYQGRRAQFVGPIRLYLVSALLFFLAWPNTLLGGVIGAFAQGFVAASGDTDPTSTETSVQLGTQVITESLPGMMIIFFVPLFAGLLHLVNWRGRPFVADVVTAAHLHVAVFVVAILTVPFEVLGGTWADFGGALLLVGIFGFAAASIARVYGVGPLRAIARTVAVAALYLVAVLMVLTAALGVIL